MRKSVAILAILACLYSPSRFGIIVLEEAGRTPAKTEDSAASIHHPVAGQKDKNIVSPGKFFRRPFCSKYKHFVLALEQREDPSPRIRLLTDFSFLSASTQPLFFYLRSPPLFSSPRS